MEQTRQTTDEADDQTPGPSNRDQFDDTGISSLPVKTEVEAAQPHGLAFLSRLDALEQLVFEKCDDLASDWKTEDLAAIFARIRSSSCSEEGIRTFINVFENTTVEDVMHLIDTMKNVVDMAEKSRFRFDDLLADPPTQTDDLAPDSTVAGRKLSTIFTQVNSRRKPRTANSERLKEVIKSLVVDSPPAKKHRMSTSVFSPACQQTESLAYDKIYHFLADASIIKRPKQNLNPLEAAVLLNVFEEVQELADTQFGDHVTFFRQLLRDVQHMGRTDLSFLHVPPIDEFGKALWNTLGLPDQLMDMSDKTTGQL